MLTFLPEVTKVDLGTEAAQSCPLGRIRTWSFSISDASLFPPKYYMFYPCSPKYILEGFIIVAQVARLQYGLYQVNCMLHTALCEKPLKKCNLENFQPFRGLFNFSLSFIFTTIVPRGNIG